MKYVLNDQLIGHGDDVLQAFDLAASAHVGRHRQLEAIVRSGSDVDEQLAIDECVHVLHLDEVPKPVRAVAERVLEVMGHDPSSIRPRVHAGEPTVRRLVLQDQVADKKQEVERRVTDTAATAARAVGGALDRASRWVSSRLPDEADGDETPDR